MKKKSEVLYWRRGKEKKIAYENLTKQRHMTAGKKKRK